MRVKTVRLLAAASVGLFNQAYPMWKIADADTAKKNHTSDLLPTWLKKPTIALEKKSDITALSPTSIEISGLPKDRLVLCLFKNVYDKSEFSKKVQMNIDDHVYFGGSKRPLGATGYPPSELEVERFLDSQKGYIDYLGAVEFKMDFSKSFIETKQYDDDHKTTSTPGVRTAKECIEQLRQEVLLENIVVDTLKKAFEIGSNDYFKCKNVNWPATQIQVTNRGLDLFTEFYVRKSIHEIGAIFSKGGPEKDALLKSIVDMYERYMKGSSESDQRYHKDKIVQSNSTHKRIKELYASSNDPLYKPMMSDSEHSAYISELEHANQIKKEKFEAWFASRQSKNEMSITNKVDTPLPQSGWSLWSMFFNSSTTKQSDVDEPKPPTLS